MSQLALLNSKAPYSRAHGQESLDLALAAGNFAQEVALFFIGDGVFQLLKQQQPELLEQKNYSKTFAALPFYDIEEIYVHAPSLAERGLLLGDLVIPAQALANSDWQAKLASCAQVITL